MVIIVVVKPWLVPMGKVLTVLGFILFLKGLYARNGALRKIDNGEWVNEAQLPSDTSHTHQKD